MIIRLLYDDSRVDIETYIWFGVLVYGPHLTNISPLCPVDKVDKVRYRRSLNPLLTSSNTLTLFHGGLKRRAGVMLS